MENTSFRYLYLYKIINILFVNSDLHMHAVYNVIFSGGSQLYIANNIEELLLNFNINKHDKYSQDII